MEQVGRKEVVSGFLLAVVCVQCLIPYFECLVINSIGYFYSKQCQIYNKIIQKKPPQICYISKYI